MKSGVEWSEGALARLRARAREFRAEGLCPACGAEAEFGRLHCDAHLDYYRRKRRTARAAARVRGLCTGCAVRPVAPGTRTCRICKQRTRSYDRSHFRCAECRCYVKRPCLARCDDCHRALCDDCAPEHRCERGSR